MEAAGLSREQRGRAGERSQGGEVGVAGEGLVEHQWRGPSEHQRGGLAVVREAKVRLTVAEESLLADFRFPGASLVLHGVLVHAALETFLQSAGSTLVPVGLVDGTFPLQVRGGLAGVDPAPVDGPLEEARAA